MKNQASHFRAFGNDCRIKFDYWSCPHFLEATIKEAPTFGERPANNLF
jgi:hypothetical protein